MKTVGIVQARMTSTRLPGKILKEVLGKPILQYELERLAEIRSLDELVVATTTNADDDPVAALCEELGVPVYRGSEFDVLSRYYEAATRHGAGAVARFTADCPLADPELSDEVISHYAAHSPEFDYCSVDVSTYPRGVDTEVFSMRALSEAYHEGHEAPEREHVSYFIWTRPERYKVWRKISERDLSRYRLTVDTPEDFALIREILERLCPSAPRFRLRDVIALLEAHPELTGINGAIQQKRI